MSGNSLLLTVAVTNASDHASVKAAINRSIGEIKTYLKNLAKGVAENTSELLRVAREDRAPLTSEPAYPASNGTRRSRGRPPKIRTSTLASRSISRAIS
jgi:hypothetical protein